jgi:hypothetical protein
MEQPPLETRCFRLKRSLKEWWLSLVFCSVSVSLLDWIRAALETKIEKNEGRK